VRELNLKIKKILDALRDLFLGEDLILMNIPFWLREEYFREIESMERKKLKEQRSLNVCPWISEYQ